MDVYICEAIWHIVIIFIYYYDDYANLYIRQPKYRFRDRSVFMEKGWNLLIWYQSKTPPARGVISHRRTTAVK